jgi:fatty acid desaturase
VSPRLWIAWHNGVHHARTNQPGDPDSYPTLEEYQTRRTTRIAVDTFAPGARRWRGVLSLLVGFTGQSGHQLITGGHNWLAIAEAIVGISIWTTLGVVVGLVPFVFVFLLPLVIGNAGVMAFILTNHALSPRVELNDPLVSGLSVTTPRIVDWLTLNFGYHVEHHLFPAMSSRHARAVRDAVVARWPERYQSMSLTSALLLLHRSARVYQTPTTLFDPKTGQVHSTLGAPSADFAVAAGETC